MKRRAAVLRITEPFTQKLHCVEPENVFLRRFFKIQVTVNQSIPDLDTDQVLVEETVNVAFSDPS